MNPLTTLLRLAPVLAAFALPGTAATTQDAASPFPPLNQPASSEHHQGKFVWADLFTTDPVGATTFYTGLFGWTADTVTREGKSYTVFTNAGRPVAGLAPRSTDSPKRPSHWIGYVAVSDLPSALQRVTPAGGTVRAAARDFPARGTQAIITDPESAPLGLLQSTSGDAPDTEPRPGDWNWFELYARDPTAASSFYQAVFQFTATPDAHTDRKSDFLLSSGGLDRAGVAPLPADSEAKSGWLGVVRVADIDATLALAAKLGGTVRLAARAAAYGSRFAIITDPTGGTIGLVQYVDNANPANRP